MEQRGTPIEKGQVVWRLALDVALDQRGIPWAVLSNTMFRGQVIERQLALCGVPATHRFVMTSTEHVLRKPHPRLFRLAADRLKCAPERIWFVGDSPEFDVQGSAAAGMQPFWYNAGGANENPEVGAHFIHQWREFIDLLHGMNA